MIGPHPRVAVQKTSVPNERVQGPSSERHGKGKRYAGWVIGLTFFGGLLAGCAVLFAAMLLAKRRAKKVDHFYRGVFRCPYPC